MPEIIQRQAMRFVRWQDRHANLLGKTLLRECLMKHGYRLFEKISYTEYNRPFIKGAIDFNISHSGNYVVCAINTAGRVGVDVERMKLLHIEEFKGYMTDEEWRAIQVSPGHLEKFYDLWTLKESVVKGDGRGMSLPLTDVRVEGEVARVGNVCWYAKKINLDSHYSCHIAANHEISSMYLRKYDDAGFTCPCRDALRVSSCTPLIALHRRMQCVSTSIPAPCPLRHCPHASCPFCFLRRPGGRLYHQAMRTQSPVFRYEHCAARSLHRTAPVHPFARYWR